MYRLQMTHNRIIQVSLALFSGVMNRTEGQIFRHPDRPFGSQQISLCSDITQLLGGGKLKMRNVGSETLVKK